MNDGGNPWVGGPAARASTSAAAVAERTELPHRNAPAPTGPSSPQRGVPAPQGGAQLRTVRFNAPASLWILGVHGGSGETSLGMLNPDWQPAQHGWPLVEGHRSRVVLVTRSNAVGLETARIGITQWASGNVPHVDVLGLVVVADAPGKLPQPLKDLTRNVAGGVPRTWDIPWIEDWRLGVPPSYRSAPKAVHRLVKELNALALQGADGRTR